MDWNRRLKVVGAVLLLASLAFPIARSCRPVRYEDAEQRPVVPDENGTVPQGVRVIEPYEYVFNSFKPADAQEWLIASLYAWPTIVLALLSWKTKGRVTLAVRLLEPLLIAWSVYGVEFISTFFTRGRAIGAYLAFVALGLYTAGTVWEDINVFRDWRARGSVRMRS